MAHGYLEESVIEATSAARREYGVSPGRSQALNRCGLGRDRSMTQVEPPCPHKVCPIRGRRTSGGPGHWREFGRALVEAVDGRPADHDLRRQARGPNGPALRSWRPSRASNPGLRRGVDQSMFPHGWVHYSRSKQNRPIFPHRGGTRKVLGFYLRPERLSSRFLATSSTIVTNGPPAGRRQTHQEPSRSSLDVRGLPGCGQFHDH